MKMASLRFSAAICVAALAAAFLGGCPQSTDTLDVGAGTLDARESSSNAPSATVPSGCACEHCTCGDNCACSGGACNCAGKPDEATTRSCCSGTHP